MKLELFINNLRVELFDDENIIYRGKLIDSQDLNSLYNDFINTFTIPAIGNANKIFKNWYQTGVVDGFDPNKRLDSYVQLNSIPLSFGKVQLEEVVEKNNQPLYYKITFYGKAIELDERFGLDELSSLDSLSKYNFRFDKFNCQAGLTFPPLLKFKSEEGELDIENEDQNIVFPFIIARDKPVEFDLSFEGPQNVDVDITKTEGRLSVKDFRPGIRQIEIIKAIEEKYNIEFSRDFLNKPEFRNSFLWLNRNENFEEIISKNIIYIPEDGVVNRETEFNSTETGLYFNGVDQDQTLTFYMDAEEFRGALQNETDYVFLLYIKIATRNLNNYDSNYSVKLINTDTDEIFYDSGVVNGQSDFVVNKEFEFYTEEEIQIDPNTLNLRIELTSDSDLQTDIQFFSELVIKSSEFPILNTYSYSKDFNALFKQSDFLIPENLPKMKIFDYITSIIKQYKLIIRPTGSDTFLLEPIIDYFKKGKIIDMTKYIDINDKKVSKRYRTYKQINYKFKDYENVIIDEFENRVGRKRGNSIKVFDTSEKNENSVSVDFAVPFFVRLFDSTNNNSSFINLALLQNEDGEKEWTDEPLIFYYNGVTQIQKLEEGQEKQTIKFDFLTENETQNPDIFESSFITFCDVSDNEYIKQVKNCFDFSSTTTNSWHQLPIKNNQYSKWHEPWLDVIYRRDNRIVEVNAVNVPFSIINNLELNSTILIDNTLYKIEEYEINLNDNTIDFNLFPNFYNIFNTKGIVIETEPTRLFNAAGGYDSVKIKTKNDLEVFVRTGSEFIEANLNTINEQTGDLELDIFLKPNYKSGEFSNSFERTGTIDIISNNYSKTINIKQFTFDKPIGQEKEFFNIVDPYEKFISSLNVEVEKEKNIYTSLSSLTTDTSINGYLEVPTFIDLSPAGTAQNLFVDTNLEWVIDNIPEWATVSTTTGTGQQNTTITQTSTATVDYNLKITAKNNSDVFGTVDIVKYIKLISDKT